jgi:hypothetical protein
MGDGKEQFEKIEYILQQSVFVETTQTTHFF